MKALNCFASLRRIDERLSCTAIDSIKLSVSTWKSQLLRRERQYAELARGLDSIRGHEVFELS